MAKGPPKSIRGDRPAPAPSPWPLLDSLDEVERRELLSTARRRRFARREVLFHHGDPGDTVHLIISGWVAVHVPAPRGGRVTLAMLGPGEAVGELALISEGTRAATAVALEPTETISVRRSQFEEVRQDHPGVDRLLVEILAARVRRLNTRLTEAYFSSAPERVVRRLAAVAEQACGEHETRCTLRLTQEDLAGLAGTSRATVNRVLRDLEDRGVLKLGRGVIVVPDAGALTRLVS